MERRKRGRIGYYREGDLEKDGYQVRQKEDSYAMKRERCIENRDLAGEEGCGFLIRRERGGSLKVKRNKVKEKEYALCVCVCNKEGRMKLCKKKERKFRGKDEYSERG